MTEQEVKTEEVKAHETSTSMVKAAPAEIDAGADIVLKVRISCPSACDLRGKTVRIIAQDSTVAKEVVLISFEETANETDEFTVKAPIEPGEYTWTAVFPAQEKESVLHEESSAPFSFIVKPHAISIAVWDVPSPIAFNDRFKLKVGVKCSAECNLMDKKIRIYDQKGKKMATGTLGGTPWLATTALYWTELELEAPGVEGYYKWRVEFRKPNLELPHEDASYCFAFTTTKPPEHVVTVKVTDKRTKTPIKDALVALHSCGTPYRKGTDDGGMARISVPKGAYELNILMADYKAFQKTLKVTGDVKVKTELIFFLPWNQP